MKTYKLFGILLSGLLLIVFFIMLFYNSIVLKQVWNYDMHAQVIAKYKKIGLNTDTDKLWFGSANPGNQATRKVNMINNYDFPVAVSITINGDIAPYISVSDNHFVLNSNETKVLTFYFTSETVTPYGNYTGSTRIIMTRTFFT